jgi:4-amino-4-deoxychorismate lyase
VSGAALIWIDGVECSELTLPDRAFELGDSLFETCRLVDNTIIFAPLHWQRLAQGCKVLGFPDSVNAVQEQLREILLSLKERGRHDAIVRVTVSRGTAPRGYLPPEEAAPRIAIYVNAPSTPFAELLPPAQVGLASLRLGAQPALAGIKHGNRLEQVLAANERRVIGSSGEAQWDDMLLCDYNGRPHSLGSANLFALIGDKIVTPPIVDCGIAGTRRQLLLETLASEQGIVVQEEFITMAELVAAQEVFCANTVQGFRPVGRLDQQHWYAHPVCASLHSAYVAAAHREVAT